jgi:hypothetical protein
MAKERASPKSDLVRQYLAKKPLASVKQIVTYLKDHGISEALASKIKSSDRREAPSPKRPGRKARRGTPDNARGAKTEAIREVAKAMNKPVRPSADRAAMAEKGIDVSFTQVSQVLKSMGLRRRRRLRKAAAGTALVVAANSAGLNIDDLVAAKKLVAQVGNIEKVKEALAALAKLG